MDKHKVTFVNSRHNQVDKYFDTREEALRFCLEVLEPRRERRTCFGWFCKRIEKEDQED